MRPEWLLGRMDGRMPLCELLSRAGKPRALGEFLDRSYEEAA
jgi:hypothetical protein